VGLRYDYSTDFGNVVNPRLSVVYKPKPSLGMKFLFGTAFRQAGIFELYSEFRGNPHLKPEKIGTAEFELNSLLLHNKISFKANVYFSKVQHYIGKVPDSTMPAGERYENLSEIDISGAAIYFSFQMLKNIRLYSDYGYIIGFNTQKNIFYEVNSVAKNKANMGINARFFKNQFITDLRFNFVGKRKAAPTNIWMQSYQNGYAPEYLKANLSLLYNLGKKITFQLLIDNLFDTQYYGLGRENGSGFINSYDPQTNPNPQGFIPAYHPQEGRSFLGSLIFRL
jgi:outer membrane cobalamin receptor